MDNSNPTPPVAPTMPEAPQAPLNPTPAPEAVNTPSRGGNMKLWIIVGLVTLLLILGGIYFYLSSQKEVVETVPQTTTQASPTPISIKALESDANSIEIETTDSDFATVDAELKNL